jgi:hypothetical protein
MRRSSSSRGKRTAWKEIPTTYFHEAVLGSFHDDSMVKVEKLNAGSLNAHLVVELKHFRYHAAKPASENQLHNVAINNIFILLQRSAQCQLYFSLHT